MIRRVLTPEQVRLFDRLSTADQAHSFRVYRALVDSGEDHPDLLTAALLHDVGKVEGSYSLWERTAAVLLDPFLDDAPGSSPVTLPGPLKRAVNRSRRHPVRGAELAENAGASPLTVQLIRWHESAPAEFPGNGGEKKLLTKLMQADNQN